MRQFFKVLIMFLPVLWILSACTTENSQIEDVAIEEARTGLRAELKTALEERMNGKEILKENYLNKIVNFLHLVFLQTTNLITFVTFHFFIK